jgi:hypothetical protein
MGKTRWPRCIRAIGAATLPKLNGGKEVINIFDLVKGVPASIIKDAIAYAKAYVAGDDSHHDRLIDAASKLQETPEGQAFMEAFCKQALGA